MKYVLTLIALVILDCDGMAATSNRFVLSLAGQLQIVDGKVLVEEFPLPTGPYPQFGSTVQIWELNVTNNPTPDSSANGANTGILAIGVGAPTFIAATNTISAYYSFDGGDSITGSVTQAKGTYGFWALTNDVWHSFLFADGLKFDNAVTGTFTLAGFVTTGATTQIWGENLTGGLDKPTIWTVALDSDDAFSNHWISATNYGWMRIDSPFIASNDHDVWSNSLFVSSFEYAFPADTSFVFTNNLAFPGGPNDPTHENDGTNSWFDFSIGAWFANGDIVDVTGDLSIFCWVRPNSAVGLAEFVVNKWDSGSGQAQYVLFYTGDVRAALSDDGAFTAQRNGATTLTDGIWSHIGFVFDAGSQTLDVWLNGVNNNGSLSGTIPTNLFNSTAPFTVGAGSDFGAQVSGDIDDVRVIEAAMTSAQVTNLYNSTVGRHP
ncbi:MAG: LamG domain-containing protein [Bacteroidetes bacterium]|nr:LamG domain-containing protein [Bacteroidota bacterium]